MFQHTVPGGSRIVAIQPGGHRETLGYADTPEAAEPYAVAARMALAGHADVLVEPTGPSRSQAIAADELGINWDGAA